jgi:hypothetical protein
MSTSATRGLAEPAGVAESGTRLFRVDGQILTEDELEAKALTQREDEDVEVEIGMRSARSSVARSHTTPRRSST